MKMHHLISPVEFVTLTNAGHLSQSYQIVIGAIVFISTNSAQHMYFNNIYIIITNIYIYIALLVELKTIYKMHNTYIKKKIIGAFQHVH